MDKINKKKNEKYTNILTAAFDLFNAKDIGSVSIDEIVKKAGVAKGTFYLYFQDKVDLVSKIILKKAAEFLKLDIEVPPIESDEQFETCLKKYIDQLVLFLENNLTLTALIDKNVHLCVNAVINTCDGPLKDLYNNISNYFENKGFSHDEVSIKMYIYIDMIVSSCCHAILKQKPYTLEQIKPYLFEIVTTSIYGSEQKKRREND